MPVIRQVAKSWGAGDPHHRSQYLFYLKPNHVAALFQLIDWHRRRCWWQGVSMIILTDILFP